MGEWDDTGGSRFGGQPTREPSDACAEDSVLAAVLRAAAASHDDDPVAAALDALVAAMGLSRASLASVSDDGDLRRLETVAAAGEHASFARDMPAIPLEQMADAAVAVTERRALYVADVHGLGDRTSEPETGVARWRSGMSAQAHALLPVVAHDQVIGVLTVEWSTPQAFTAEERESLEGVALLFGLILWAAASASPVAISPAATSPSEPASEAIASVASSEVLVAAGSDRSVPKVTPATGPPRGVSSTGPSEDFEVRLVGYGVTTRGAVVPDEVDGPRGEDLAVHVTIASGEPTDTSCPFWGVVGAGTDTLVVVGGTVQAPRGAAAELASACAAMLRTACSHGGSPAEALRTLGAWLITSGPGGAWVSAGCWSINVASGTTVSSVAGAIAEADRSSDGRTAVAVADQPALGVNAGLVAADSYAIRLPGDSIAICAGSIAWARTEAGRASLDRILADEAPAHHASDMARRLVGLSADSTIAPLVAFIEVLGG